MEIFLILMFLDFLGREQRRQENHRIIKKKTVETYFLIDVFPILIKSILKILLFYWINQVKKFKDKSKKYQDLDKMKIIEKQ